MGKKCLLGTVAAVGLTLGMATAQAADIIEPVVEPPGWYVSLFGGVSFLEDVNTEYDEPGPYEIDAETKTGFIVGGALGTHLTEDFRVELEVAYSENDVDDIEYDGEDYAGTGDFTFLTFMGNVWYDVPLSEELKPYLGGGAGIAIIDANDVGYEGNVEYDSSEVAFAFQVGAGLRWAIADSITLDVGYRLRGFDGPKFEDVDGGSDQNADWMWSHNVIGGVSFGF
jgi:opacity protein-like surface antigen